jgi:pSer/pThr/pTyr-binding forkhead associated (FHA) protein
VDTLESLSVEEVLLILKVAFLVLLYLFIWRVVRQASRDIRVSPQESVILRPDEVPAELREARAAAQRRAAAQGASTSNGAAAGRLQVLESTSLEPGSEHPVNGAPVTIGRGAQNVLALRGDGFASAVHAQVEARPDGVWVTDHGSTNGTFVNGDRIDGARKLERGDVIRIGETDLRFET